MSSPLFALVGWILILHLDRSQQERHAELEMEAEVQQAERDHKIATHEATMRLRKSFLESHATYLEQEVNSPEIQRQLAIGASVLAARELSALTGMHIAPRLSAPASQTQVREETLMLPEQAVLPAPAAQAEDQQVERLTLLAEAAQAQGYSLDDLERLLGVPSSNGSSKKTDGAA